MIFDADDIEGILQMNDLAGVVPRFSLMELRSQIQQCELHEAVSRTFGEDDIAYFYSDLAAAMTLARDILLSRQSTPHPRPMAGQPRDKERLDAQTVKARVDIVTVAEKYTKLRKAGANFSGLCPLHADKRTASFFIYASEQRWFCFGACNRGGDVIELVMAAEHVDFRSALQTLAQH